MSVRLSIIGTDTSLVIFRRLRTNRRFTASNDLCTIGLTGLLNNNAATRGQCRPTSSVRVRASLAAYGQATGLRLHVRWLGTHEDERTVLYRTKSLDGTKPNTNRKTNAKTNPNPTTNPNPNPKLTQILNLFSYSLFSSIVP